MLRFTITQLLMGTALIAILLVFTRTEGCGTRCALIECVSFSTDGTGIAVSRLDARDARHPKWHHEANISRTLSWLNVADGASQGILHQDFQPGDCGRAYRFWHESRTSAIFNPASDRLTAIDFGGGGITHYPIPNGPSSKPIVALPGNRGGALNIAISKSGRLIGASIGGQLTIIETATNRTVRKLRTGNNVPTIQHLDAALIAFSDDERQVAIASDVNISVWDIATGFSMDPMFPYEDNWIRAIAAAPNNRLLVCSDRHARLWDFSGDVVLTLADSENCDACAVSIDGKHAALVRHGDVLICDLASGARTRSIRRGLATELAFSPDGQSLAVGSTDGTVSLFDVNTGRFLWSTTPPGRHRWPWTYPACFVAVWAVIAWRLWNPDRGERR